MDGQPNTYTWPQAFRDFIQFLTMACATYAASVGSNNYGKIEVVEKKQQEVVVKQDSAAEKAAEVKATLEKKIEEDDRALGISLYSTWKYLEDVAASSGLARDKAKAAEAKAAYEDHVKKGAK